MEGEVGAQVAPSVFFHQHQALPGSFHEAPLLAKKRDFPWKNNPNFPHAQEQEIQRHRLLGSSLPSHGGNWNPRMWDWDGVRFTAQPSTDASEVLHLGSQPSHAAAAVVDQRKGDEGPKDSTFGRNLAEDDQNLSLKLGGEAYTGDEPAARPNKRVRSGLPGSSGNYPMCQVDDCQADLSSAKDYHKRHKVCEVHSKTAKALVGKQMQRFCQQCSRFHPLSEFDEGKRSCRRRLAGHNRRRRKTQPEDASSKLLPPRIQESTTNGNLDIVNLLAIFAHLQGNNQVKPGSIPPLPDQDRLVQLISKLSAPNNANPSSRSSIPVGSFDLNVSQVPALESFEQSLKKNSRENAPSTTDLLTALSAALAASAPNGPVSLSQGSSESSGNNKAKIQNAEPPTDVNSHNKSTHIHPSMGVLTKKCTDRSGVEVPCRVVHKARQSLPLQLFGPADDESPTELGSTVKYLSSESSNPMEERSPSSSPPVTKKLFPLHSTMERQKYAEASECQEDNATIELSVSHGRSAQLQLFKESDTLVEDGAVPSVMRRAGYKSSGSDHSPSSSNSDAQDRTGRITFKLFGKDPSCFPDTLRTQVFSWLSNSPSEMESYIRPGCVVLSIYLSMPSIAWEELDDDLLQRVTSLVQYSDTEFWRNERFLVSSNKQLVSHKDGKIRLSKTWRAWSAPELTSISPVAIVGGKETSLVLKGRNLTVPGTKIHCAYMGKYISKVLCSAYPGTIYDDSCVERFDFPGGSPRVFGRCFIEVENGFKGNSFPVIIADASICQELRALESDFDEDVQTADAIPEEQVHSNVQPRSREDVMHFLNELGWLFQRTNASSSLTLLDFSITRFKYLFTFSVERDWCNLIKTLLDILVERSSRNDALEQESLEMLSEVHLLIRAVNRRSKQMIDLLLHYCVCHGKDAAKVYLFPPNMSGPGGMTPLHMAASMQDAEDIVDALTNDPQEVGINCWNSLLDDSDQSPNMYATLRNNLSYNRLVARKLADRTNGQVTISVVGGEISMDGPWVGGPNRHGTSQTSQLTSCAQCALMGARPLRRTACSRGLLQRPYVHSMLAIAAVCVCVCLFFRGSPQIGSIEPFKWENLDFGPR